MTISSEPFTKEELLQTFGRVNKDVADFFSSIPTEKFYLHPQDVWSVRENLDHLNKAVSPLITALSLPKIVPSLLFGKAKKPSRRFEEIRLTYQSVLKDGGKAGGRFLPDKNETPKDAENEKQKLLRKWKKTSDKLISVLKKWSEKDLDTYTLPHPLLGKLTVREMLFFTLYHNTHHVTNVRKLLEII